MKNTPLKAQAFELSQLGFSVIPLNSNKKPLIKWARYQNNRATNSQIRSWFRSLDVKGIGIITGKISELVVIDVDPRHGGSNAALESFNTPTSKTGSNGWHFYFRPVCSQDYQTIHLKGYDILGNGAYVIAPPSLHPNGQRYEWIKSIFDTELKDFPFQLAVTLGKSKRDNEVTRTKVQTKVQYKEGEISRATIESLRALPIVQVFETEGLNIPASSKPYSMTVCPFHNDKTPSLAIYHGSNYAHCFGCNKRFNTIDFIREYRNLDFREACFYLMEKYGISTL